MTEAIFTTKVDPTYDDLPEYRYCFPQTCRRAVETTIGDWIVHYEPRRSSGDVSSRVGRRMAAPSDLGARANKAFPADQLCRQLRALGIGSLL
jgi:hypothetical protein